MSSEFKLKNWKHSKGRGAAKNRGSIHIELENGLVARLYYLQYHISHSGGKDDEEYAVWLSYKRKSVRIEHNYLNGITDFLKMHFSLSEKKIFSAAKSIIDLLAEGFEKFIISEYGGIIWMKIMI